MAAGTTLVDNSKLEELLGEMQAMRFDVNKQLTEMTSKIEHVIVDVDNLKSKQIVVENNLQHLNTKISELETTTHDLESLKNIVEQEALKCDVICFGIPSSYHMKLNDIIDCINRSLSLNLDTSSFQFIRTSNNKKLAQCSMHMKFVDYTVKLKFMNTISEMSRDRDGKRHPLTVEDIFEELKDRNDPLCGKQIYFNNKLTKLNQEMLSLKRTITPKIILWEKDGRILMKRDEKSRVVEAKSIQHIRDYARGSQ